MAAPRRHPSSPRPTWLTAALGPALATAQHRLLHRLSTLAWEGWRHYVIQLRASRAGGEAMWARALGRDRQAALTVTLAPSLSLTLPRALTTTRIPIPTPTSTLALITRP